MTQIKTALITATAALLLGMGMAHADGVRDQTRPIGDRDQPLPGDGQRDNNIDICEEIGEGILSCQACWESVADGMSICDTYVIDVYEP